MTSGSARGRPKRVPPCRAAAMPAFTRSTISSLGQGPEHVQHQAARRCCGINAVRNGPQVHAAFPQQVHRVQHIDQGPAEPVHPPHHDRVTRLHMCKELLHPRTLNSGLASGGDVSENIALLHSGIDQRVELQLRVLARRAHTRLPEMSHPAIVPQKAPASTRLRQFTVRHLSKTRNGPAGRRFPLMPRSRAATASLSESTARVSRIES